MSETAKRPNQGKAAKDLNEAIRYTMWSASPITSRSRNTDHIV